MSNVRPAPALRPEDVAALSDLVEASTRVQLAPSRFDGVHSITFIHDGVKWTGVAWRDERGSDKPAA